MTDNRNRTAGNVRHHFDKYGGNLGATGCVSWSFDKQGRARHRQRGRRLEEDNVMMDAMDCGADDFEAEEDVLHRCTPTPDDFNAVADALTHEGLQLRLRPDRDGPPELPEARPTRTQITKMEKLLDMHGGRRRRPERLAQLGRRIEEE